MYSSILMYPSSLVWIQEYASEYSQNTLRIQYSEDTSEYNRIQCILYPIENSPKSDRNSPPTHV